MSDTKEQPTETTKPGAVKRIKSALGAAFAAMLPSITSFKRSSFPGRQYPTRFYETATALIKDLGPPTSKDLEFAAILDRIYAPPTIVEFYFSGGPQELPHGLSKAPRFVVPVGMELTETEFGWVLISWDDTNIKAAGLFGTVVRFACYP